MAPANARGRTWIVPLVVLIVLAGAFAGVAASSRGAPERASAEDLPRPAGAFVEHLADELGMPPEALLTAAARATEATLDDLREADLLTRDQANLLRSQLGRAVSDPKGLERGLKAFAGELHPYRRLAERVELSVKRSLASALGVRREELGPLLSRSGLAGAARRAGVDPARLEADALRAARRVLLPAARRGLITPLQAHLLLQGISAVAAHHS
jgi:hypothetical protein